MTDSTEYTTPPKHTKSCDSNFWVQNQMKPQSQFEFVPRQTEVCGIIISRISGFRVCGTFSGNCHIHPRSICPRDVLSKETRILSKETYILSYTPTIYMPTRCPIKKETHILSKETHILSKETYILSYAPTIYMPKRCPIKRDPYSIKRDPYSIKRDLYSVICTHDPYAHEMFYQKRPIFYQKRPIFYQKRPIFCHIHPRSICPRDVQLHQRRHFVIFLSKEIHILSKKDLFSITRDRAYDNLSTWLGMHIISPRCMAYSYQKRPIFYQKRPIFYQKRPILNHKRPHIWQSEHVTRTAYDFATVHSIFLWSRPIFYQKRPIF